MVSGPSDIFERTIISKEKGACRCRDVHTCDSYNKWNFMRWVNFHEISRWIERLNSRMTARFAGFQEWAFHSRNAVPKSCQPKCQKVARKKTRPKKKSFQATQTVRGQYQRPKWRQRTQKDRTYDIQGYSKSFSYHCNHFSVILNDSFCVKIYSLYIFQHFCDINLFSSSIPNRFLVFP